MREIAEPARNAWNRIAANVTWLNAALAQKCQADPGAHMNETRAGAPRGYETLAIRRPDATRQTADVEFVISKKNGDALETRVPKHPSPTGFKACLLRVPVLRRVLGNNKKILAGLRQELIEKCGDEAGKYGFRAAGLKKKNKYDPVMASEVKAAFDRAKTRQGANIRINAIKLLDHESRLNIGPNSPNANLFLRQAFLDLCLKRPEYLYGKLMESHRNSSEQQARQRYAELLKAPGMTEEKLEGILQKVMATEGDASTRLALAREAVIDDSELPQDTKDFLKFAAKEAPDLEDQLRAQELLTVVARYEGDAQQKIDRTREHLRDKTTIQASPTLKDDQKTLLIDISRERCMDGLHLEQYATVARTMINAMLSPAPDFDKVEQAFSTCCSALKTHGEGLWAARNMGDGDAVLRTYADCAAFAARSLDAQSAELLFIRLYRDPKMIPMMALGLGKERASLLMAAFAERANEAAAARRNRVAELNRNTPNPQR